MLVFLGVDFQSISKVAIAELYAGLNFLKYR